MLVLHRYFSWVPTYFEREVMTMEGHGIPWWEPFLRAMCDNGSICLDMLMPMLYIFVWPERWGAIRDKGFAHVTIVEFKALD